MKRNIHSGYIAVIIGIILLFTAGSANYAIGFQPWPISGIIGEEAPEVSVSDLNGKKVLLSSFKGKPILLNFWATW